MLTDDIRLCPTLWSPAPPIASASHTIINTITSQPSSMLTAFSVVQNPTVHTLFLLYINCAFVISSLLSTYVILSFMRCLNDLAVIFASRKAETFFPYKLMVTASLLYAISAYASFHRNFLLSDSGGNLQISYIKQSKQKNSTLNSRLAKG